MSALNKREKYKLDLFRDFAVLIAIKNEDI